ncbi:MAG: hypothetical protein LUC89_05795 [Oscillospiraceae bacterium]|nr:hypothetical protein [Oscillospiraceae bacterium]
MRIQLEDLEDYLAQNGWTEKFQQSKGLPPYDRARPQGQTYNTLNANYQKIINKLDDMLPKASATPDNDGFDSFVAGRNAP